MGLSSTQININEIRWFFTLFFDFLATQTPLNTNILNPTTIVLIFLCPFC